MKHYKECLNKEILQVRFRPTLEWFSARSKAISKFQEEFEEWKIEKEGNIVFYSPSKLCLFEVFTNQITYVSEGELNSDKAIKYVKDVMSTIIDDYEVSNIRRIGYRTTKVLASEFTFQDITDSIYQNFYNNNKDLEEINIGKISDIAYVLNTTRDAINTHTEIGAVKKVEGEVRFQSLFSGQTETRPHPKDDNNLFIDIDVFVQDGLTKKSLDEMLDKTISLNHSLLEFYLRKLDE